jgi:hypothetical protein
MHATATPEHTQPSHMTHTVHLTTQTRLCCKVHKPSLRGYSSDIPTQDASGAHSTVDAGSCHTANQLPKELPRVAAHTMRRTVPHPRKCTTAVGNQLQGSLASWLGRQQQPKTEAAAAETTKTSTTSCTYDCSCCFSRPSAASSAPANAQS